MVNLKELKNRIKMSIEIGNIMPIARRYFVIGAFDGALTILGVILGAYIVGALTRSLVLAAGTAAGVALAISSAVGAYEAERIESALTHKNLERAMLSTVEGTQKEVAQINNLASSFVHGIAPLVAAFVPLIPFIFMEPMEAMIVAIIATLVFLFAMGVLLGRLIKEMIVYTGLRFVVAGLATAILLLILGVE